MKMYLTNIITCFLLGHGVKIIGRLKTMISMVAIGVLEQTPKTYNLLGELT